MEKRNHVDDKKVASKNDVQNMIKELIPKHKKVITKLGDTILDIVSEKEKTTTDEAQKKQLSDIKADISSKNRRTKQNQ